MAASGHKGLHLNEDGYLRFHQKKLRNKYAHRVYMERLLGRPLRLDEEVEHLCKNRQCWPPTDFHLCLMDAALHHGISARVGVNGKKRRRQLRLEEAKAAAALRSRTEPYLQFPATAPGQQQV